MPSDPKISGMLLCIDLNELLISEPLEFVEKSKAHTQLLTRFCQNLNYKVDTGIIFTKLDALAGFSEFYEKTHSSDLDKPFGFSVDWILRDGKWFNNFKTQFDKFMKF